MADYPITWPTLKPGDLVFWNHEIWGREDSPPRGGSGIVISVEPAPGLNQGKGKIGVLWSHDQELRVCFREQIGLMMASDDEE